MSAVLERILVGSAVLVSCGYVLRVLLPFSWRVVIARRLQRRVPDAVLIWIAGRQGCEACGVARPPPRRR